MVSHHHTYFQMLGLRQWTQRHNNNHHSVSVMIIYDETDDRTAELLFTAMIKTLEINDSEIYLSIAPKDPQQSSLLQQQIALTLPRLLLALGDQAAHSIINTASPVTSLRTEIHQYSDTNIPVVITYRPADLIENPGYKKNAYADLLRAKQILQQYAETHS